MNGTVIALCISPVARQPMRYVEQVLAIAGAGLEGDRYCTGNGSFNKGEPGKRQVSLMNAKFFPGSGFDFVESRRSIFTEGVELMYLIGRDFKIGQATFRGIKYNPPCKLPSQLAGKARSFAEAFHDTAGIVADVLEGGIIKVGDIIIPPPKSWEK